MIADVGQPVPDIAHAVSVSLPTWNSVVGYEEGESWVLSKMKTGYPRFFIHLSIQELEGKILKLYGESGERVMLFPSLATSIRCQNFLQAKLKSEPRLTFRLLHLEPTINPETVRAQRSVLSSLHCVFFPSEYFSTAKQVWQHTGDGISSRRAEFCLKAMAEGILKPTSAPIKLSAQDPIIKGPRRYQRGGSQNNFSLQTNGHLDPRPTNSHVLGEKEHSQFIEERFGRNLNAELAFKAKLAIRRRISGCLIANVELDEAIEASPEGCDLRIRGLAEDDVYLYPTGMSAIYNSHRILMALSRTRGRQVEKSICFGFPYIDTLKVLEKWGPGCLFYGNGVEDDLDDLERRLEAGERYLALYTEFPSNPLLRSPNLIRIRQLASKYGFAVVVDETVGNFININVLQHADIVVSSLTKVFSGDSNVMGGSYVLNPHSSIYHDLKQANNEEYEDNYWAEDAVYMERNSRDFITRIERINDNTSKVATKLRGSPIVKTVYYPENAPSRPNYDACRNPNGGYGGLLSVTFKRPEQAVVFFDSLQVQKGPSLGSNFTLSCPYTVIAHYMELDWANEFGVERDLVRISIGLENEIDILNVVQAALDAALKI